MALNAPAAALQSGGILRARVAARTESALQRLERSLDALEHDLARARFREVLRQLDDMRADLEQVRAPLRSELRVRLELIAATAHLAFDAWRPAGEALSRALAVTPDLELDSASHPRKLALALERIRLAATDEAQQPWEASELTGAGDARPELLVGVAPLLPGETGALRPTIVCRVLVSATGGVANAHVYLQRPELGDLERRAVEAVYAFRFRPGQRAGQPVPVWINYPLRFR